MLKNSRSIKPALGLRAREQNSIYLLLTLSLPFTARSLNRYTFSRQALLFQHRLSIMPRRSSGGRSAPRPRPAARSPARNPPQTVSSAPPPAPVQGSNGSMLGGLGAVVGQGLAFGTGSAVAHRAVDAVMGPRVVQHENVPSSASEGASAPNTSSPQGAQACGGQFKAFQDCLDSYGSDIGKCQIYMEMLQECRRSSGSAMSS